MSAPRPSRYFRAPLYPYLGPADGGQPPRFLLPTSWQVLRPDGARVLGHPWQWRSLLALDDLFLSVLPFTFRTANRVHVRQRSGAVRPWNDIPCDLGECTVWVVDPELGSSLQLSLTVRLPQRPASPEPSHPLIGTEFLRHYEPRLSLWYRRFAYGEPANENEPVGRITWA
jgi:hypothetical protein